MFKFRFIFSFLLASLILVLFSTKALAYYSTIDTGELLPSDTYRAIIETQFVTDPSNGVNFVGRFDGAIDDETGYRALLGFGETDFHFGGFVKWIPIPDLDNQPAIGVLAGVLYANDGSLDILSLRLHPLISKKFELEAGVLTPYASLPFGIQSIDGKTTLPLQLAVGSEYKPKQFEKLYFGGELGFDLAKSYTYFSLFAAMNIDEEGIAFR